MRLSYAQRLEDYHLDLVFADRASGTYVDVGGGHPVADNVSFWFYLKGWNGLIVEPQAGLAEAYAHIRPRDRVFCGLAGSSDGESDFYVVDRLHGLSTTSVSHAEAAADLGTTYTTARVPVRTLASLCDEHGIHTIDFLKVDVEGAEAEVLRGADWQRVRPRVVVVEAAAPGSAADAYKQWDSALLAQSYTFAFDDQLNRFYVADEARELAARFPREPAPWDAVEHLWDCGRALERAGHPDHELAQRLVDGFLAALPGLDPALIRKLIDRPQSTEPRSAAELAALLFGKAEYPGASPDASGAASEEAWKVLLQSDRFRAALGRIASSYDGGHLTD